MYNVKEFKEKYRSGHNELHSKCSCRVTGTWVRIPSSPPTLSTTPAIALLVLFLLATMMGKRTRLPTLCSGKTNVSESLRCRD